MDEPRASTESPWIPRILVGLALVATLWLAGPRALAVLRTRAAASAAAGPRVALDRVGLRDAPAWLRGPLLERVLADLEPALHGSLALADDAAGAALRERLRASPWVVDAVLQRAGSDRLTLALELREPVLAITVDREVVVLADAHARVLPGTRGRPPLPAVALSRTAARSVLRAGSPCTDPRITSAARVAVEWRDEIEPRVPGAPRLLEIDSRNVGGRFLGDPRYSEVLVALDGDDGPVWMQYGRAADDGGPIPAATKAEILAAILAAHPVLRGLAGGDLRLSNRWRDCLVARDGGAVLGR